MFPKTIGTSLIILLLVTVLTNPVFATQPNIAIDPCKDYVEEIDFYLTVTRLNLYNAEIIKTESSVKLRETVDAAIYHLNKIRQITEKCGPKE